MNIQGDIDRTMSPFFMPECRLRYPGPKSAGSSSMTSVKNRLLRFAALAVKGGPGADHAFFQDFYGKVR